MTLPPVFHDGPHAWRGALALTACAAWFALALYGLVQLAAWWLGYPDQPIQAQWPT